MLIEQELNNEGQKPRPYPYIIDRKEILFPYKAEGC